MLDVPEDRLLGRLIALGTAKLYVSDVLKILVAT